MTFEEWFEQEFPEEMSTPTLKLLYKEIAKKGWDAAMRQQEKSSEVSGVYIPISPEIFDESISPLDIEKIKEQQRKSRITFWVDNSTYFR